VSQLQRFENGKKYIGAKLNNGVTPVFKEKSRYVYSLTESYVIFYEFSWLLNLIFLGNDKLNRFWLEKAESTLYRFRHNKKEILLNNITRESNLNEYLSILKDYVFCDQFSLWTYNEHTSVFTCEASSFSDEVNECVYKSDKSGLHDSLRKDYAGYEGREINGDYCKSGLLREIGIKSLNRIKLTVGDNKETKAVVTFYSSREKFYFEPRIVERIKSLVELKYIERVQLSDEELYELSNSTIPNVKAEGLEEYLVRFVKNICVKLNYEACSVFLVEGEKLVLKATSDFEKTGVVDDVFYLMTEQSMTVRVAKNNEILCCYNLKDEMANSHIYNEKTAHEPGNWIGIPLDDGVGVVGVLRVKNKFSIEDGVVKIRQPLPLNFINLLKSIVILKASVDIFRKYKDLNDRLKEQNNFNRVLLHEIRTPISKFNMGPEIIKMSLEKENIEEGKKRKILNQLSDIQVMGGRLKMITDAYNFEEIIRLRKEEEMPLLHAVVYPVLNITKPFLEKQHDCYIDLNVASLHSWRVRGDKDLYGMALNALMDNAAKYCNGSDKVIRIYGDYDFGEEFLELSVRNKGFSIDKNDRKKIFEEGYRGKNVVDEKIHGTGIGLFLAHKIMVESGGDLRLRCHKNNNDIEFVMIIPVAREMVSL